MSFGIRVTSDSGTIQVDQDYTSFGLAAKGTLVLNTDSSPHPQPISIGTITVYGTSPVIAYGSSSDPIVEYAVSGGGGVWTFYILAPGIGPMYIPYYVFDRTNAISGTDSWGMEIYRSDGSRAFNSGIKTLNVIALPSTSANNSVSESLPAGKTYAWIQSGNGMHETLEDTELDFGGLDPGYKWMIYNRYLGAAQLSGNYFTGGMVNTENIAQQELIGTSPYTTSYGTNSYWIVDVTNY